MGFGKSPNLCMLFWTHSQSQSLKTMLQGGRGGGEVSRPGQNSFYKVSWPGQNRFYEVYGPGKNSF